MKIKVILRIVFLILIAIIIFFAQNRFRPIETGLAEGFIRPNTTINQSLLQLSEISSNRFSIIFETNNYEEQAELHKLIFQELSSNAIEEESNDFAEILDIYKIYPENFLTTKTKSLLIQNKYSEIEKNSLELLYNPLGIFIQNPDRDPYLFATDYVINLQNATIQQENYTEFNGKIYSRINFKIKNPQQASSHIAKLLKIQKELNRTNSGKIYLTGTPIHSIITKEQSSFEINIICIISIIALISLCKFYFKSFKILLPIGTSIVFGMLLGYLSTLAITGSIHILTIVFSTTLIGISLDYSLHYIIASETSNNNGINPQFYKNLTTSMITTILAFATLLFSGMEILKQISIFTGFGLFGVYTFVILFFPKIQTDCANKIQLSLYENYLNKYKNLIIFPIIIIIIAGLSKISFNYNLTNLYKPTKQLLEAEILQKEVFKLPEISFITVKNKDFNSRILTEEKIAKELEKQNIKYISMSKLIPSTKTQLENRKLVEDLYNSNLDNYANFLDKKTRNNLKKSIHNPTSVKITDIQNLKIGNNFKLNNDTSIMILYNANNLQIPQNQETAIINIQNELSSHIKKYGIKCLSLLPYIFLILGIILCCLFGFKRAFRIILSPLLGTLFAISCISLTGQPLNLFNILAMFLITGFSLDYSIFRDGGGKNSNIAVLISFISTALSFLLLSFTSFKLISSLGQVLFLGITSSYILSLVLIPANETEHI